MEQYDTETLFIDGTTTGITWFTSNPSVATVQQGKVVACGPGKKDEPMEVKVGDEVLYGKYAGTEVTVEDKKYLIVRQSDIMAIL